MAPNAALSKTAVDEAGVATGVGSDALPLCSEIGNSEETACKPRSEPSTKVGRGVAGTVNTEAARESLVHTFTGKPIWHFAKRRVAEHGRRILEMEHRRRQPSSGARVGENLENRQGRA